MKITKRLCCILLALLMCLPLVVACGKKEDGSAETTAAPSDGTSAPSANSAAGSDVTDEVVQYDENGYMMDNLGNMDFGGKVINILGWTEAPFDELDLKYEDIEGTKIGQQVYNRNRRVEARMKVKISVREVSGGNAYYKGTYVKECEQAVTDQTVDVFACYSMAQSPLMVQGYLANLRAQEVMEFDKPWWSADLVERASLYDRLYFATGSIAPSFLANGFMMMFNKEMVDQYLYTNKATEVFDGAEDLYAMVYNDTWTMDNFITLAKNVQIEGGTKTATETYGYVVSVSCVDPWYQAADLVTLDNAPDGSVQISDDWNSAKAQDVVAKMYEFFMSNSAGVDAHMSDFKLDYSGAWGKGTAMFTTGTFSMLSGYVTGSSVIGDKGVGILPMPKYNSDQEEYLSTAGFPFTLYSINRNSDHVDACAATLECMASEGYRLTEPALYDTVLKIQSTDSNQGSKDRDMMDVIRDTIRVDVGRIHNDQVKSLGWGMVRNSWYTDMQNQSPYSTYESFFESKRESLEKALEQMNETVYNIESVYG